MISAAFRPVPEVVFAIIGPKGYEFRTSTNPATHPVTAATMKRHADNVVGRPAVGFELDDTNGRTHRLQDYAGRWLLIVFHRHLA